jgi:hypothetical protein
LHHLEKIAKMGVFVLSPQSVENLMAENSVTNDPNILETRYHVLNQILQRLQENFSLSSEVERKRDLQQLILELNTEIRDLGRRLNKNEATVRLPGALHDIFNAPTYIHTNMRLFKTLKSALTDTVNQNVRPLLLIEGSSGNGKSTLAAQLARDDAVRLAFPDGIFWIEAGNDPDISALQNRLLRCLGQGSREFVDIEAAADYIRKVCENMACLFILDDVWEIQDVLTFFITHKNSQMLVTTAHPELYEFVKYSIPAALGYKLDALEENEAQELFLQCAGRPGLDDLNALVLVSELIKLAHYNPHAIRLLASCLRQQPPSLWEELRDNFNAIELDWLEDYPEYLQRALQVALDSLGEDADYYFSLAVFQQHNNIPQAAIVMFWQYLYKIQEKQAYQMLSDFAERGLLILSGGHQTGGVHLQDFQYAYLHSDPDLDKLHTHLLTAYNRQSQSGWLSGPNDGYFYRHLCLHLSAARRMTELKSLLLDFEWLVKKLQVAGTESLLADFQHLPDDEVIQQVRKALRPGGRTVAFQSAEHLADTLFDSFWEQQKTSKDISALLNQARETLPDWEPPYPDQEAKFLE